MDALATTQDPVGTLHEILAGTWESICKAFELQAELPELQTLFHSADLDSPAQAARKLLSNMLLEVVEGISRFSPWYKKPARAFGLVQMRDWTTGRPCWSLAPEAAQRWQSTLDDLGVLIDQHGGIIEAVLLVDSLMLEAAPSEPCLTAECSCLPPRQLQLQPCVLEQATIICNVCLQPFQPE
jgi:hypothetical protein